MKEVFLKKLILKNFKKIQDLTVEFTDKNIEKVDVKDSNIELGNELKQKFIIDKK